MNYPLPISHLSGPHIDYKILIFSIIIIIKNIRNSNEYIRSGLARITTMYTMKYLIQLTKQYQNYYWLDLRPFTTSIIYYLQICHLIIMYFSHSNYYYYIGATLKSQNENVFERTRKFDSFILKHGNIVTFI